MTKISIIAADKADISSHGNFLRVKFNSLCGGEAERRGITPPPRGIIDFFASSDLYSPSRRLQIDGRSCLKVIIPPSPVCVLSLDQEKLSFFPLFFLARFFFIIQI
jgi:hypothetical protein